MAIERYFVPREEKGLRDLDSIVLEMERFPVKVEMKNSGDKKGKITRPDHFSFQTYENLALKKGLLPIILYESKFELIFGVNPASPLLTEDGNAINFTDLEATIEFFLPTSYREGRIGSDNIVPILLQEKEYDFLYTMAISPEERKKFIQEKQHLEAESSFDIRLDPATRNILRQIYRKAFSLGASDIHFEWTARGPRVRYRVNDLLQDDSFISPFAEPYAIPGKLEAVNNDRFRNIIGAIKVDAGDSGVKMDEHRKTQSGGFDFDSINWGEALAAEDLPKGYRARVSILPSIYGENVVLRLLEKGKLRTLHQLGYSEKVVKQFEDIATEPHGIIIATGPTGSGKTTTLNAVLSHSNSPTQKIITIENPVEYTIHGVHQCEVKDKINSFESYMREILRHDPDVAMIGEIRDKLTADVAINLALTGHLVYATLHTNDAIGTLLRLQKMGIQDYELQDTIKAVFAQRLTRQLCSECKEVDEEADINSLFRRPLFNRDVVCYKSSAKGCDKCNGTGISGRSAITEVWQISEETKDLIVAGVNSGTKYLELAIKEGMRPLAMASLDYLVEGRISLDEVIRVVGKPSFYHKEKFLAPLVSERFRL